MLQIRSFDAKGRAMPMRTWHGAPIDALTLVLASAGDCIITAPIDARISLGEFHDALGNGGGGNFARFAAVMTACGIQAVSMKDSRDRVIITVPASIISDAARVPGGPDHAMLKGMLILLNWVKNGGARPTMFEDEQGKQHTMRALAARYELNSQDTAGVSERALKDGMIAVEVAKEAGLIPVYVGGKARCLSQALETMLKWGACRITGMRGIQIGMMQNDPDVGIPLLTCFGRFAKAIGHVPSNRRNGYDHFLG